MTVKAVLFTGGRYLTIPEVGNKRTGRGARLVLPLTPPWNDGNLCLSFRHKLAGHHVGMLQVFVKKGKQYSPAVWGRTGGNGWRHTQITLWGKGLESVSITKYESEILSYTMCILIHYFFLDFWQWKKIRFFSDFQKYGSENMLHWCLLWVENIDNMKKMDDMRAPQNPSSIISGRTSTKL